MSETRMTLLQRWLGQPQNLWVRRALFQIHLWTGIGTGLYVLLICVSGSALVFRTELHAIFEPQAVIVSGSGERMTEEQVKEIAQRAYAPFQVTDVWKGKNPDQAIEIWFDRDGKRTERLFDPYTGADLGAAVPPSIRLLLWLVTFHDTLMYEDTGRTVNGVGAIFLTVLCLTGAVIWWPGIRGWRRSLTIEWKANWKRLNWTLHSAMGFWSFVVVFMFAFSGVYLVFQEPFMAIVDYFEPLPDDVADERAGDTILRWVARVHFGRFAGWGVKATWVVLGLAPPFLFVTGAIMWWNRVLRNGVRRSE